MGTVMWFSQLARDTGKPVLILHHLRKRGLLDSGEGVSLDRVRDSSTIVQPARVVWALDTPNPNADPRRLSVIKSNLARFPDPIGFTFGDDGLTFGQAPEMPKPETQEARAKDLLRALLADGPMETTQLEQEAKGAGVSMETMRRAKDDLAIKPRRDGKTGKWSWALPAVILPGV